MAVIYLLFALVFVSCYGDESSAILAQKLNTSSKYTEPKQDIVIPIMIHLDKAMTRQAPKVKESRKKLKFSPKSVLRDVEKIFNSKTLNQRVHLKLVNVKTISNKTVTVDENVSKYLKNYCTWQKDMKVKRGEPYFSVLLTGLDIYYVGKNGVKVKESTGRGYMSKICSMNKSCAVVKWHPKDLVYLLAHEIAHSLGVYHDSVKNGCRSGFIMTSLYSRQKVPQHWSNCSKADLQKFLRSKRKSWCVTTKQREVQETKRVQPNKV